MRFYQLSLEQGLSHSLVLDMVEDDLGFLWFGTQDGLNRYDGYEFKVYYAGKSNKTPSKSWIIDLYKDKYGQIWIFYQDKGLDRFDPQKETFYSYYPDSLNPESISSNSFFSSVEVNYVRFFEDRDSTLWIATDKGLNKYIRETDSFESLRNKPWSSNSLSCDSISTIAEDKFGYLWIGTHNGLNRLNKKTGQIKCYFSSDNKLEDEHLNVISCIHFEPDSTVWIGTVHDGLYIINNAYTEEKVKYTQLIKEPLNPNYEPTVYQIYNTTSGNLLIGTEQGLYHRLEDNEGIQLKRIQEITNVQVSQIIEDDNGYIWIGSGGRNLRKIFRMHPNMTDIQVFEKDKNSIYSFGGENVQFFCKGKNGLLWIGTEKGGVYKVDLYAKKFRNLNDNPRNKSHLTNNQVYSIYEDSKNNLWVGTALELNKISLVNGNMKGFNNNRILKTGITWEYSENLSAKLIGVIKETKDNKLWMGSFDYKISLYDPSKNRFLNFHQNENDSSAFHIWSMRSICETSSGDVYFGGTENGLCKLNNDGKSFLYYPVSERGYDGTNDSWINIIIEDSDHIIWIGTLTGGLNRFDPVTGKFSYFINIPADSNTISNDYVRCILEPEIIGEDILWIGTNGGLNKFDKKTGVFKSYTIEIGFPNNTILGILEDNTGRLWISTNKGLVHFDPITEQFKLYTYEDGLQSNEFNEGAYFKSKSGVLYFGGVNGITYFKPDEIDDNPYKGEAVLTAFKINQNPVSANDTVDGRVILNTSISYTSKIILNHRDKILSFEFASTHMVAPKKVKYRYKLEGFEEEWNEVTSKQRFANYTNIPSGEYKLKILSTNSDGIWSDKPLELDIHMLPPFWEQVWFKLSIILSILLLIGGVIRIRTQVLKHQKDILRLQVQQHTKDLKQANETLEKQKVEILDMANKLHESDQMKLRFFTNISHEFRTPLTLIMSPLEKLLSKNNYLETTRVKEDLNLIYRNGKRLFRLINQLLEIRRVETGNLRLETQEDDIITFMYEIFQLFISYADKKDIDYRFLSDKENLNLFFDSDKIEKIFYNLISNAIKHTPEGGKVEVSISEELQRKGNKILCISVSDDGPGIPPKYIPYIFDRFFQITGRKASGKISSGIGLSLVKDLVKAHYGEIKVQSEESKGTTFKVFLPATSSHLKKEEILSDKEQESTYSFEFSKSMLTSPEFQSEIGLGITESISDLMKVLIVEDNLDLQQYLLKELNQHYQVIIASNGKEGLNLVKEQLPDLVICDVMMPEMDGIELCKLIKCDVSTSHIPVFLLTAKSEEEYQISGLETGADDYITKPFSLEVLKIRIKNILKSREQLANKFSSDLNSLPAGLNISQIDQGLLEKFIKFVEGNIDNSNLSG
ncbi:MAG: response regulator, partial [Bacteroidales bacterium]